MSTEEDWKETYSIIRCYDKDTEHYRLEIEDMINGLAYHVHKHPSELFDGKKEFHLTIGPHSMEGYVEVRMVRRPVDRHTRPEVKAIMRQIRELNDELNVLAPHEGAFLMPGEEITPREKIIRQFFASAASALELLRKVK